MKFLHSILGKYLFTSNMRRSGRHSVAVFTSEDPGFMPWIVVSSRSPNAHAIGGLVTLNYPSRV